MLGHRKLVVEDYLDILKRRRWIIAIPVIILPILAVAVTFKIAPRFVSQTLVIIEEQKVPDEYVKSVISENLDGRLASMKEQILSRSRIQPVIERYNLYPSKRANMDDRIDLARKNITIKPIHSEIAHAGGLPGFFITFTANDAHTAQLVCADITSLFLSENLRAREESSQGTTDFLKGQLDDAKRSLDEQDAKLANFQRQYIGKLPGQEAPNLNMLTSLNTQLEAATQALARMEQDKTYQESMLSQIAQSAPAGASPTQAATPQAQETELLALQSQEAELLAHYTPEHPDVIAVRHKIADIRRSMERASQAPVSAGGVSAPSRYDPLPVQQLRAQIHSADIGIQAKRREQQQIESQVHTYQDRIQSSPLVEEQYKQLTRDYDTAQKFYDDLLTKMNHSKMATDLEKRQQGEQFRVMDEPNLPEAPTFPKKWIFGLGGLFGGLLFGLAITAFLEYKDTSIRSERDIWAFTKLPTLAVIEYSGEIQTENTRVNSQIIERPDRTIERLPPAKETLIKAHY
ncbi:GumC family protein [Granulicella sibirica]|uniref:Lipopolysaccharide biosynthesis n=1 Tax=Granulicella sibirica TaxID=2479048 RepID=A0A4Q0SYJ9_9BACT|nr:lipopolysaccharide biosynthesis protein [Granulicella sibirica]RXH54589.1 lipopolysaccharide biosynthesis [Granulicella sibirica]